MASLPAASPAPTGSRAGADAAGAGAGAVAGHLPAGPPPAPGTTVSEPAPPGPTTPAQTAPGASWPTVALSVDTLHRLGPVSHVGQGFLHSVYSAGDELALFRALGPTAWRSSLPGGPLGQSNLSRWQAVQGDGVPTTLILSDMWYSQGGHQGDTAPWDNWSYYRWWVQTTVLQIEATGYKVGYWDVYNEPDRPSSYTSQQVWDSVTPDRLFEEFLVAYQAIRSIDGSARVIGPSLAGFSTPTGPRTFSMADFLSFAAAHWIQLAAVSWHFNSNSPGALAGQVTQARRLVASHPQIGHPLIFVNEYGSPGLQRIPGWDLAYLAALNDSGVDRAERSCWYGDCNRPVLDGLLAPDGVHTLPDYWLRVAYAQMTGTRVATWSSDATVPSVASFDPGTGTVTILLGRAVGCAQDPRCGSRRADASPVRAVVSVHVPWASGVVRVTRALDSGRSITQIPQPSSVTFSAPVVADRAGGGRVTITLDAVGDGDAEVVQLVGPAA